MTLNRAVAANEAAPAPPDSGGLRESEERFRIIALATNDAVWDRDLTSDHVWRADGFESTLGTNWSMAAPSLTAWSDRLHPEDRDRVLSSLRCVGETGRTLWHEEYRIRRPDGGYADVLDRGYILRDKQGRAVRLIGGSIDISEKKRLEAQAERAQRMESIGALAGGIAHDLNNVLAPVLMSIELLRQSAGNDAHRHLLHTIEGSVKRGANLVQQVLSFARGSESPRAAVSLGRIVRDMSSLASETFPPSIKVETDIAINSWPVSADATQLHQVALNLAVNARDAMPSGGMLCFVVANEIVDRESRLTDPAARPGKWVTLTVSDTGTGIPPEVRARLFEPFFTTKQIGQGTGLGLANVHSIVRRHGGFLTVESEIERGTIFKVYLPADETSATPPPVLATHDLPHGHGELVLVVDDEASIRSITEQTLTAFGYRVLTARNGAEAIELYEERGTEIALVLTDTAMPTVDGPAEIRALRQLNPSVKIVVMSGLGEATSAPSVAPEQFLAKPYTAEQLLTKLDAMFSPGET